MPEVGVVYAPFFAELFWAVRGRGGYLRDAHGTDRPIRVSSQAQLTGCMVGSALTYAPRPCQVEPTQLARLLRVRACRRFVRRAARRSISPMCARASGCLFQASLASWDTAAGALLVRRPAGTSRRLPASRTSQSSPSWPATAPSTSRCVRCSSAPFPPKSHTGTQMSQLIESLSSQYAALIARIRSCAAPCDAASDPGAPAGAVSVRALFPECASRDADLLPDHSPPVRAVKELQARFGAATPA